MKKENLLLGTSWFVVICMALFTGTIEYSIEGILLSRHLGYVIAISPHIKKDIVLTALLFLSLWLLLRRGKRQSNVCWAVPLGVFLCEFLLVFSPTNLVEQVKNVNLLSVILFNPVSISFFLQGILLLVCLYFSNRNGIICCGIALIIFGLYFSIMSNQFILCHSSSGAIRISSCIVCSLPVISIVLFLPCKKENSTCVKCFNLPKVHMLNDVFTSFEILIVILLCYLCILFAFDPLPIPTKITRIVNAFVCLFLVVFPILMIYIQKICCSYIPSSTQTSFLWRTSIWFVFLSYLSIPITLFRIVCEYRLVYMEMILYFPLAPWYCFSAILLFCINAICRKKKFLVLMVLLVVVLSSFFFISLDGILLYIGSIVQYLIGSFGFFLLRKKNIDEALPAS